MKHALKILCLTGLLVLAGCASTPSNYYTLVPLSIDEPMTLTSNNVGPYVLGEVAVPADIDQTSLVVQDSDGRLLMLEYDRWVAPVSAQLQNALSKSLTQKLGFPPVHNLNVAINDKRNTRIRVAVHSFDLLAGRYAELSAAWQISFAGTDKTISCFAQLREPVNPGVSELVAAQKKNVNKLADLISTVVKAKSATHSPVCQAM
ncbi:hypothetical protein BCM14_0536 [Jezberella montanilacus]|jgi:uncharacterized lipoprotein YmbA|uniref:ABC-type transport auxiliary lipoprotein component domain-containing protein n=1 Tax=Jezberella montanilacus TaxID=323426 RepID=A0A2T0XJM2_9BURK|nr:PqiC family protein [Jezberella montanilacus]PRY99097.1 hypothetical protein BCM14_0536 [Jezberella montanilacus]